MLDIFNNRELASILLASIFITYTIYKINDKKSIFKQFFDLFLAFFEKKLRQIQYFFLAYIFIEIIILHNFFYWDSSYLKDTVMWMFSVYFLIMKHSKLVEKKYFIKNILIDNLKFIAIFEFIVNLYTFNFIFEFIMLTIITFIVLVQTVMEYQEQKEDTELVKKVFNFILSFFTITILFLTIKSIYDDYQNIVITDLIKKFFLPFLLTLFYLPFYYILILIFKYESIFVLVDLYQKDKWLNIYTKIKIILTCFMSYDKLKKINLITFFLSKANSKKEIKVMIKDIINDSFDFEKDYTQH